MIGLAVTQSEMAKAMKEFTDSESVTRGRIANWEYANAPIPSGIWKKLPVIFAKALEAKKDEVTSSMTVLAKIEAEWEAEVNRE